MYSIGRTSNCELLEGPVFLKLDILLYKGLAFLQPRGSEQAQVFFCYLSVSLTRMGLQCVGVSHKTTDLARFSPHQ